MDFFDVWKVKKTANTQIELDSPLSRWDHPDILATQKMGWCNHCGNFNNVASWDPHIDSWSPYRKIYYYCEGCFRKYDAGQTSLERQKYETARQQGHEFIPSETTKWKHENGYHLDCVGDWCDIYKSHESGDHNNCSTRHCYFKAYTEQLKEMLKDT